MPTSMGVRSMVSPLPSSRDAQRRVRGWPCHDVERDPACGARCRVPFGYAASMSIVDADLEQPTETVRFEPIGYDAVDDRADGAPVDPAQLCDGARVQPRGQVIDVTGHPAPCRANGTASTTPASGVGQPAQPHIHDDAVVFRTRRR